MRQRTPLTKVVAEPPKVAEINSRPDPGMGTVPGAGRKGPGEADVGGAACGRGPACCARASAEPSTRAAQRRAAADRKVMVGRVLPNARDLVKASGLRGRLELVKRALSAHEPITCPPKMMKMSPA